MPIVNHVVLASGAVVAVSVAVAAALAMYESPELRRYADDIRRRIAMTLHSMGDGINPPHREPRFNRPEDAEGFMLSRPAGAEPGVDADDETRRRQREELLYWNRVLLEKKDQEEKEPAALPAPPERPVGAHRGSSFDDFLRKDDEDAETGAYVFKTGAEVQNSQSGLRHRGEGSRGFSSALYSNPFADEHHIDSDDVAEMSATFIAPGKDEGLSDIYSATTREADEVRSATLEQSPALIDVGSHTQASQEVPPSELPGTLERELAQDEYMSAGQEDRHEAYASIQAWAQDSSRNFYSPLPITPAAPMSEPELVSDDGQLTPTDSVSLVGSGEDVAQDARSHSLSSSQHAGETGRPFDVLSASEGMLTPASWSEVGSVISESDAHGPVRA
ncbi:C6 zinc finger domain-containing protein [Purpureocillium lavendulum]|uniref:C6 zinc finger domain-containing protein n=1 Tax=Purpureocillium lavendulum TaxID=1247861 RepID=A0AB34G8U4_9HYPO|nr:C6 zinc finger domain-containing protein [Purpureocillium lavendulum]